MAEITPVVEWPDYSDNPQGGNPYTQDLLAPYDKGDLCWLLVCTIICWFLTPAIGFFYAGMHRRKSAFTMIFQSLFCSCACGIQYWVYGYSLYQARTTGPFIGDLSLAGLHNVLAQPSMANSDIPDILYAVFGFTFVTATAMILAGAMLERGRLGPSMLFLLCWTTFVYYFLAYWEWNPSGWLYELGIYDFAGSGPVHIASGFAALAWSLMLGPRKDPNRESLHPKVPHFRPHNPFLVGLGTVIIWFGWFAFNGASTANLSLRSIYVVLNTNLAACGGGLTWVALEYAFERKFSILGFCTGIIAGLVGITPAAGFVEVYVAAIIGAMTAVCSFFATRYKNYISIDDGLDIFALHGVGGFVGDILTGLFASSWVPALDGASGNSYAGGWWDRHWKQMGYQLAAACSCAAWSFTISCILLFIINRIPGCHIRAKEEDELLGLDAKYFSDVEFSGYDSEMHGLNGLLREKGSGASSMKVVGRPTTGPQGVSKVADGEKIATKSK
ncbi:ammonium transporter [Drepanopeziza brunnea f. sp. 'multigermtubi' MB_m1]|uniref:Ammonium transporter n=2 Tax=Drepanopeziza brunnea f. sp. 'multigermtubi' TaxID=698441 RepID=K1WTI3_MARBU|nr:ammonium transporter [Drepanopeziza brunnea f. sp. 'multigermtubi' MB_m1]EKD20965.1 ammonium transporter [Drepanopeziza brunnea f. sp. 'multigermtubi' MB_m1]